jgi:hypothetical protein
MEFCHMKCNFPLMISAVILSAIAGTFSVFGLTAIFAGHMVEVALLGAAIEVSKVVAVIALHRQWHYIEVGIKTMLIGIVGLASLVTMSGDWGFLTQAFLAKQPHIAAVTQEAEAQASLVASLKSRIESMVVPAATTTINSKEFDVARLQRKAMLAEAATRDKIMADRAKLEDGYRVETAKLAKLNAAAAVAENDIGPAKHLAELTGLPPETAVKVFTTAVTLCTDPLALTLVMIAVPAIPKKAPRKKATKKPVRKPVGKVVAIR